MKRFLSILISVFFIFSALAKLYSTELFEISLNVYGLNLISASLLVRFIIMFELVLGISFLFPYFHKNRKIALGYTLFIALLLVASILFKLPVYHSWFFGKWLKPNLPLDLLFYASEVILLALLLKFKQVNSSLSHKKWNIVFGIAALFAVVIPNIISLPDFLLFEHPEIHEGRTFQGDSLLKQLDFNGEKPQLDDQNIYLLYFVTPTCPYCKMLTRRTNALSLHNQIPIPVYFVFLAYEDYNPQEFWDKTNSKAFPTHVMTEFAEFEQLAGNQYPAVFLMKGSQYYSKMDFRNMKLSLLHQFIKSQGTLSAQ